MRGRLFSYVGKRYEDGAFSGVPRFDFEIRSVFPSIKSVTEIPTDLDADDVVITDNHLVVNVPPVVRTIGVHHGCAKTHYDRDPAWRTPQTEKMVVQQHEMFFLRNRFWVSPTMWARDEFRRAESLPETYCAVIPHWAKRFGPVQKRARSRPVVIGDWRDRNKGAGLITALQQANPGVEFRQLNFKRGAHEPFYLDADLYLCLSVSEGGSYAVADAEACGLPIVTTDVGWCGEFTDACVIPWKDRESVEIVSHCVKKKLSEGRALPSFFEGWTFEKWSRTWRAAVEAVSRVERDRAIRVFPAFSVSDGQEPPLSAEVKLKASPLKYPAGLRVLVGLAGGIGNSIFNLPMLKAMRELGHVPIGYVETDYPSASLWSRCRYLDRVVEAPDPLPAAEVFVSGPWAPRLMSSQPSTRRYVYPSGASYAVPEWKLILKAAEDLGWAGERPDVSDWCLDLDRSERWHVGIAAGCKPGTIWERKKYPKMPEVAEKLLAMGLKVCSFGTERDPQIPGVDMRGMYRLGDMPEALASCRVVVGVDGGIMQLAASLGIPSIVIYTATNDVKGDPVWAGAEKLSRGIPCSPCQSTPAWSLCQDWICRDIPVDLVVGKILKKMTLQES